jgi:HPr kinase/phosphorylase
VRNNTDLRDSGGKMPKEFSVSLQEIIDEFELEKLYLPETLTEIKISECDLNRPGLQLSGFYEYYDNTRIQLVGKSEIAYLEKFTAEEREEKLKQLLSTKPPAFVITRGIEIFDEMIKFSKIYEVPLLRSTESTSVFMAKLIAFLNIKLAPRITRHGVLIEVYGEGMLILGESGVGKSETAIELVKRGHRLVADDAVEIRRTSNITLVGSSPDNIRHFLELRGIGIINARQLFGMGAVKISEKIDIVVELEQWNPEKVYDRMGIDNHYMSILGVKVPNLTIPVKPGRNLAVILEVAAMNNRQKKMGYNAAQELLSKLGLTMETNETVTDWEY